jgi:hypothetical protein
MLRLDDLPRLLEEIGAIASGLTTVSRLKGPAR